MGTKRKSLRNDYIKVGTRRIDGLKTRRRKTNTYEAQLPLLELHGHRPWVLRQLVDGVPRPLKHDLIGQWLSRHLRVHGVGARHHLVKRDPPLHEGNHSLPLELRDDAASGEAVPHKALQSIEEGIKLLLLLRR